MDNDIIYWIWLQCCFGTESQRFKQAIEIFGSPKALFDATEMDFRLCGIFSDKELRRLSEKSLEYSETAASKCDKLGYDVIHYNHESYPCRLRDIKKPPVVLYVSGELTDNNMQHVGIVGTRNPDKAGKNLAYSFGYDISADNMVVVSGGASGIDIYSHKGAIEANGKTVAVLGCGIDMFESGVAKYLTKSISGHGAVISEYPPGYPPRNFTFPIRNRIISGMSDCILTVQAGLGSGALITVKYALEQNRKVFAVPGSMDNSFSCGTNYMLKCGFSAALCKNDIVEWLNLHEDNNTVNPSLTAQQIETLSVRPEIIEKNQRPESTMPVSLCYELISNINISESGETESNDNSQLSIDEVKQTDNIAQDKETVFITDNENDPHIYIMSPTSMNELFSNSVPDSGYFDGILIPDKKTETEMPDSEKFSISTASAEQNILNFDEEISIFVEKNKNETELSMEQLTEDTLTVYHTISDIPVYIDDIADATGFDTGIITSSLTELELYGYVERLAGKKYVRK